MKPGDIFHLLEEQYSQKEIVEMGKEELDKTVRLLGEGCTRAEIEEIGFKKGEEDKKRRWSKEHENI